MRSAAPTPDTAHPSRVFNFWSGDDDELDKVDENEGEAAAGEEKAAEVDEVIMADAATATADGTKTDTTDFQKYFWENRGDLNRSWKKRRKVASKEKRNRENRARAARAI